MNIDKFILVSGYPLGFKITNVAYNNEVRIRTEDGTVTFSILGSLLVMAMSIKKYQRITATPLQQSSESSSDATSYSHRSSSPMSD